MNKRLDTGAFIKDLPYYKERVDLAAAFRWTARLDMHEAVANHYSLAINSEGTQFLINANQIHFSKVKASNLLLLDANDKKTLSLIIKDYLDGVEAIYKKNAKHLFFD